jgi:hypothetical protein
MSESNPPIMPAPPEAAAKPARFTVQPINGGLMLVAALIMFGLVITHPWMKSGSNPQGIGLFISASVGIAFRCMVFALILSWVSFHLAKKSQRVASIVFGIVFVLFAFDGSASMVAHRQKAQREIDAKAHDKQLAGQREGAGLSVGDSKLDMATLIEDAKSDPRAALVLVVKQRSDWFEKTVTDLGAKKAAFEADGGYHPNPSITKEALELQIERARELTRASHEIATALENYDQKLRAEIASTKAPKEYVEELLASYYSLFEPEAMHTYFSLWETYYSKGLEFLELAHANLGNWTQDEEGEYKFSSPEVEAAYQKLGPEFDAAGEQLEAFLLAMQAKAAASAPAE